MEMVGPLKTKQKNIGNRLIPIGLFVILVLIWQFVVASGKVERYILPAPTDIVDVLIREAAVLFDHSLVTIKETLIGLLIGIGIGFILAILMDRFKFIRAAFYPFIVLSQTIPTVAIAPILVIWFGYEMLPKVILIVLTTFYPIAMGVYDALQQIDKDYLVLLDSMKASQLDKYKYAKIPMIGPNFFSSLKISTSYAVIAAVVSEWLGGFKGLGVYMTRVRKAYALDKMFAVIIITSLLSMVLVGIVTIIERSILKWNYVNEKE